MATVESAAPVKFHMSLNVGDLGRSVAFYHVLFGQRPAKLKHDYAKFELDEPPVVLSLIPASHAQGGALNHLGIRLPNLAALIEAQARLEAAGMSTQREEGVECCTSRQTKFWVSDPDQNLWEIYILLEDLDAESNDEHHASSTARPRAAYAASASDMNPLNVLDAGPAFWQHFLTTPLPERIPHDDDSLDEVRLEGAFNMRVEPGAMEAFLADVRRVLRPGGRVLVHGLVGSRPFPGEMPTLPGPAVWVKHVPLEAEPLRLLAAAGFVGVECTKLAARANFELQGVELREMKLVGVQPAGEATCEEGFVVYRGPYSQIGDDEGHIFPRGERVRVCAKTWATLRSGPAAEQLIFLPVDGEKPMACCS